MLILTKEIFDSIFTIENRYNEVKSYLNLFSIIENKIKEEEGHSEEYYIDSIYYDHSKGVFELEIFETDEENAEIWIWNDTDLSTKTYNIQDILKIMQNVDINEIYNNN